MTKMVKIQTGQDSKQGGAQDNCANKTNTGRVRKALLGFDCQPSNMDLSLCSFCINNMIGTEASAAVV